MCRKIVSSFLLCFIAIASSAQFKLYEKGHDSYAAGKYDEAISLFSEYLTKVTRDKNMDVEVYYLRALSYYKKNEYQKAIGDFEETLLQNHKNRGNIHWFKAKCHEKLGQKADAVDGYTSALRELDSLPDSKTKLLLDRGRLHKNSGDLALAVEDFNQALSITPNQADVKKELNSIDQSKIASRATPTQQAATAKNDKPASTPAVVKKEEQKPTEKNNSATKPNETTLAKNDAAKNEAAKNEAAKTDKANSGAQPGIGQKVKNVAGKVGDKVSDTFRGDGKTDQKPTTSQPTNTPTSNTNTAANTPANAGDSGAPLTLAEQYKDEKRYALIIGNSSYSKSIGVLRNPVNDATDLAKELQASNFEVQLLTNATYGQMRAAMLKFKDKIDAGEKDKTVSLFYFAGHGLQYEDENYLVPVDAMIEYQDDISRYCFGVQKMVLANMERSNSRMNIVILDACRNNPFPAVTRSMGNQGLGEMKRARGSFIAYATAPGSVASDGTGRNGLYTQELLKAMRKPGLTIEQVFKNVRANVLKLSDDKQNTWDSSNITGEFYFKF
ncbi:caspase family protein [Pseudochryseolinea flava]|uniref:Caspase family p20 domain-containing protein n=1 Tax=Pseudochryseolinea flava TaxID=2059302 RepID=A0A364Y304_9BACT|nr:caspase family protein [Pseudochryseolinea flava]RAW01176.1 hypothetical protein DQQ10_09680 [Pseudochryseolinea flava]